MSRLRDKLDDAYDQSLHGQVLHVRLAAAEERETLAIRNANRLANQLAETQEDRDRAEHRAEVWEFWSSALFLMLMLTIAGIAG